MNKLILLLFVFFQGMSFLTCKSVETSSKKDLSHNMQNTTKKANAIEYKILNTNYYSSNPYAQGIYIAHSYADAISIMEGNDRNDEIFSKTDFEKETLIFVFAGRFNTGGYSIEVDSIKRTGKNKISAIFSISSPEAGTIVTQAFTNPSIIVSVKANKNDIIKASFK
ncbi:MAG: protease complex subunit PrcB family protein [Treponema sp.]